VKIDLLLQDGPKWSDELPVPGAAEERPRIRPAFRPPPRTRRRGMPANVGKHIDAKNSVVVHVSDTYVRLVATREHLRLPDWVEAPLLMGPRRESGMLLGRTPRLSPSVQVVKLLTWTLAIALQFAVLCGLTHGLGTAAHSGRRAARVVSSGQIRVRLLAGSKALCNVQPICSHDHPPGHPPPSRVFCPMRRMGRPEELADY